MSNYKRQYPITTKEENEAFRCLLDAFQHDISISQVQAVLDLIDKAKCQMADDLLSHIWNAPKEEPNNG